MSNTYINDVKGILKECKALEMQTETRELHELLERYGELSDSQCRVVVAGQYNSGKSSLLNALCDCHDDPPIFMVRDVVTTKENQEHVHGDFVLVDTPGYGNTLQEYEEARIAWQSASVILFVHSALNGSVNDEEFAELRALYEAIPDADERIVFVLSKCGQVMDSGGINTVVESVTTDLHSNNMYLKITHIDSVDYLDGIRENEPSLCKTSGIPTVWQWIHEHKTASSRIEDSIAVHLNECKKILEQRAKKLEKEHNQLIKKHGSLLKSCLQVLQRAVSGIASLMKDVQRYEKEVQENS